MSLWLWQSAIYITGGQVVPTDSICSGKERIYHVNSTPGSSYIWSIDGRLKEGFALNELTTSWNDSGTHLVEVMELSFTGCLGPARSVRVEVLKPDLDIGMSRSNDGLFNLNCYGDNNGFIDVSVVNINGKAEYHWSDGSTDSFRNNLASGTFGLIVTDPAGCQSDTALAITQPDPLTVREDILSPLCDDSYDGAIELKIDGGSEAAGYHCIWSDNSTESVLKNIPAGTYQVIISDKNGCSITKKISIASRNLLCLNIPGAFSPNGDQINDTWNITNISLYPMVEVTVYNRWGEMVWNSQRGYPVPWDGKDRRGRELPLDSYHYAIDTHNGSGIQVGTITLVK